MRCLEWGWQYPVWGATLRVEMVPLHPVEIQRHLAWGSQSLVSVWRMVWLHPAPEWPHQARTEWRVSLVLEPLHPAPEGSGGPGL